MSTRRCRGYITVKCCIIRWRHALAIIFQTFTSRRRRGHQRRPYCPPAHPPRDFFFFFRDLIERFFRLGWFRHVYGRKRPLLVTSSRSSEERYYYYYYGWWWWWRKKRFFPQRCFWPTAWTFYSLGERSSSKRQCQKRWHLQTTADGDYYRPPHSFKEMKLLFDPPSSSFSDSAVQ